MATAISVCLVVATCHNHALIFTNFRYICIECQHCMHKLHMQVRRSSTSFFAVAHLAHSCIWKEEEGRLEKSTSPFHTTTCAISII